MTSQADPEISQHQNLTDEVLHGMFAVVEKYRGNIRPEVIFKGIKW